MTKLSPSVWCRPTTFFGHSVYNVHIVIVAVDMSCGSGPAEVLIQRHVERASPSSHGFNCSWAEYKNGFFDTTGNFWIGNEKLHQATSVQNPPRKRLRVELTHHNGNVRLTQNL